MYHENPQLFTSNTVPSSKKKEEAEPSISYTWDFIYHVNFIVILNLCTYHHTWQHLQKGASLLVIYFLYVEVCNDTPEDGLSIDH